MAEVINPESYRNIFDQRPFQKGLELVRINNATALYEMSLDFSVGYALFPNRSRQLLHTDYQRITVLPLLPWSNRKANRTEYVNPREILTAVTMASALTDKHLPLLTSLDQLLQPAEEPQLLDKQPVLRQMLGEEGNLRRAILTSLEYQLGHALAWKEYITDLFESNQIDQNGTVISDQPVSSYVDWLTNLLDKAELTDVSLVLAGDFPDDLIRLEQLRSFQNRGIFIEPKRSWAYKAAKALIHQVEDPLSVSRR
jgi:hypothetical protein